jgi:hypothetical protein
MRLRTASDTIFQKKGVVKLIKYIQENIFRLIEKYQALTVAIAIILIFSPSLFYGLPEGHDTRAHITWISAFYEQISEGDYYPRLLTDGNYGWGSPSFVFYPPLMYWIGAGIKTALPHLGYDYVLLFVSIISFIIGSIGMNYCLKDQKAVVKTIGILIFAVAPYHLYADFLVRSSLTELFAMAFIPWLFADLRAASPIRFVLEKSILIFLIAITNAPSIILSIIGFGILWAMLNIDLLSTKPIQWIKRMVWYVLAILLGLSMSTFYLYPALTTSNPTMNIMWEQFHYSNGFIRLLPVDMDMDYWKRKVFYIVLQLIYFIPIAFAIKKVVGDKDILKYTAASILVTLLAFEISDFAYEVLTPLQKIQFPWRWLAVLTILQCIIVARIFGSGKVSMIFKASVMAVVGISLIFGLKTQMNPSKYVSDSLLEHLVLDKPQPPEYTIIQPEHAVNNIPECLGPLNCRAWMKNGTPVIVSSWSSNEISIEGSFKPGDVIYIKRIWWKGWSSSDSNKYMPIQTKEGTIKVVVNNEIKEISIEGVLYGNNIGVVITSISFIMFLLLLFFKFRAHPLYVNQFSGRN